MRELQLLFRVTELHWSDSNNIISQCILFSIKITIDSLVKSENITGKVSNNLKPIENKIKSSNVSKQEIKLDTNSDVINSEEPLMDIEETGVEWVKYTDMKNGYSFRYPKNIFSITAPSKQKPKFTTAFRNVQTQFKNKDHPCGTLINSTTFFDLNKGNNCAFYFENVDNDQFGVLLMFNKSLDSEDITVEIMNRIGNSVELFQKQTPEDAIKMYYNYLEKNNLKKAYRMNDQTMQLKDFLKLYEDVIEVNLENIRKLNDLEFEYKVTIKGSASKDLYEVKALLGETIDGSYRFRKIKQTRIIKMSSFNEEITHFVSDSLFSIQLSSGFEVKNDGDDVVEVVEENSLITEDINDSLKKGQYRYTYIFTKKEVQTEKEICDQYKHRDKCVETLRVNDKTIIKRENYGKCESYQYDLIGPQFNINASVHCGGVDAEQKLIRMLSFLQFLSINNSVYDEEELESKKENFSNNNEWYTYQNNTHNFQIMYPTYGKEINVVERNSKSFRIQNYLDSELECPQHVCRYDANKFFSEIMIYEKKDFLEGNSIGLEQELAEIDDEEMKFKKALEGECDTNSSKLEGFDTAFVCDYVVGGGDMVAYMKDDIVIMILIRGSPGDKEVIKKIFSSFK